MMYTVCQQNNDKISDNLLPWKMRKIFILFLGKKDSSNSKKKKKRVQHYEKESQSVSRFCNWTFVLMHKIYNLN